MILKLGNENRQFIAMLARPPSPSQHHAWLFCSPFGQEAVRTAPLYRVISERLVRAGHAVMRFDYHGCGDSSGEFGDSDLSHLVQDTCEAFEALRNDAAAETYSLFGLSLGGTVAALAAASAARAPDRVLLWKPVINGSGYCNSLLGTHRQELVDELERDWQELTQTYGLDEPSIPGMALGSTFGERFSEQLMNFDSLPIEDLLRRGVEVRIAVAQEAAEKIARVSRSANLQVVRTAFNFNWMAGEAESTAIAPQEIVKFVLDTP